MFPPFAHEMVERSVVLSGESRRIALIENGWAAPRQRLIERNPDTGSAEFRPETLQYIDGKHRVSLTLSD